MAAPYITIYIVVANYIA